MNPASNPSQSPSPVEHRLVAREYLVPFVLVTALFFLWGIPNNLNDVLIKQFMKSFEISRFKAGLLQSAFYMGYFLLSMPAALIMRKYSYKVGLVTGLLLFSAGAILFWPAALVGKYGFFLFALFVIASGLAFLETGANPFIAQLGDPASSERRLNFSQAFNPFGTICGALGGTLFIFSGIEHGQEKIRAMKAAGTYASYLHSETMRVIAPYVVLGCVVFAWACWPSSSTSALRWAPGATSSNTCRTTRTCRRKRRGDFLPALWRFSWWGGSRPPTSCGLSIPVS